MEQDCWLGRNNKGSKPQGNMYKHTRAKLEDNEREREGGVQRVGAKRKAVGGE